MTITRQWADAAQQPQRAGEIGRLDQRRRLRGLGGGELQPELRGLMDGLEQQLVPVHPFVGPLLQREERLGVQVALVVRRGVAGQDGLRELRLAHGLVSSPLKIRIGRSPDSGTPASAVTSQVSCM